MLSINVSHAKPFLSYPYEEVLCPRLERAQRELLNGGGKGDDFIGWVRLPAQYDRAEYARILAAAKKIQGDSKALVVIGIGGSYLGARGVIECLCSPNYNLKKKDTPNVYFIGNGLSSAALREVMELIGDDDFSVNVISKSGTTTEPAVAFRFFRERLEQKYGKAGAAQRIYATTDAHKGALKSLADAEGYEEFVVPDNVGGRYSVLTAVGLLPIAVAGVDTDALLAGAREMEALCEIADYTNPAWQYAAMRHELYRSGKKIELLACFEPSFRFMAEWWKQLYGESEGKEGKGLFPASVDFTADLHSMGQYIQQGERTLLETVVRFAADPDQLTVPHDDEDFTYIPADESVPRGADFAVRIQGDSMEPYIHDESVVYVNRDPLADGDVGIFCVDGAMLCKQYHRDALGMTYLFSLNRARADADVVLTSTGTRSLACFGRVMLPHRLAVPQL